LAVVGQFAHTDGQVDRLTTSRSRGLQNAGAFIGTNPTPRNRLPSLKSLKSGESSLNVTASIENAQDCYRVSLDVQRDHSAAFEAENA